MEDGLMQIALIRRARGIVPEEALQHLIVRCVEEQAKYQWWCEQHAKQVAEEWSATHLPLADELALAMAKHVDVVVL